MIIEERPNKITITVIAFKFSNRMKEARLRIPFHLHLNWRPDTIEINLGLTSQFYGKAVDE